MINEKCNIRPPMSYDEVCGKQGSVTKAHINNILVKKGIYKEREAFKTILNGNHPDYCCAKRDAIEINKAIEAIIKSGGIAGLPHPALVSCDYPKLTDKDFLDLMRLYFNDIKIIETEYPYHTVRPEPECRITPESENFWRDVAKQYDLIGVGGSDGHQKPKGPKLGERRTDKAIVDRMRNLCKKE
jgi:predicted metal-dependent phosphoesterase TrpH